MLTFGQISWDSDARKGETLFKKEENKALRGEANPWREHFLKLNKFIHIIWPVKPLRDGPVRCNKDERCTNSEYYSICYEQDV